MPLTRLQARFEIPRAPRFFVERPALATALERELSRRLLLVTGGAGTGKTIMLAAWARAAARPPLWLALDEGHREPGAFLNDLAALLGVPIGDAPSGVEFLARVVDRLSDRPATLVLDDAHLALGDMQNRVFVEGLIDHLPRGVALVLSSREALPLAVERVRAAGELGELNDEVLRFSAADVLALDRALGGDAQLSSVEADRVVAVTEGWAAGVAILLQAVGGSRSAGLDVALERVRTPGKGWCSYFAEEVLCALPPELRALLLEGALLPVLSEPLCDRLWGHDDRAQLLEAAARGRCFIWAAGATPARGFCLHPLFREFLLQRLESERTPDAMRALWSRAGQALAAAEWVVEALVAFARAGDAERFLELVDARYEALLSHGNFEALERALELVPAELRARSLASQILSGSLAEFRGDWDAAEAIWEAALGGAPAGPLALELKSLVAQQAMRRGRYAECFELASSALDEAAGKRAMPARVLGRLHNARGVAACDLGRLADGEAELARARRVFRRTRDHMGEGRCLYLLAANVHAPRGSWREARRCAQRAVALLAKLGDPRETCHARGVLGWVLVQAGERERGLLEARAARAEAEALDYGVMLGITALTLGQCALFAGDLADAESDFEAALAVGERLDEVELRSMPHVGLAGVELARGAPFAALAAADCALQASHAAGDVFAESVARTMRGRALRATGETAAAAAEWGRARENFAALGAAFEKHRVELLLAALEVEEGREPACELGALLLEMASAEHEALLLEEERAAGLVVLGATAGRGQADEKDRRAPGVVRLEVLGPARLVIGARELRPSTWPSRRARRLFELLVLSRGAWLPRERVLEALWPGADPSRSAGNLRQSLLLLRRQLEPELAVPRESFFVRHRGGALQLVLGDGAWCDMTAIEVALSECETALVHGRDKDAELAVRRALELFRGELFAESPLEEYLVAERELLHGRLLRNVGRVVRRLRDVHAPARVVELARAGLAHDPFDETLHQVLFESLVAIDRRTEALEAWQHYEARVVGELGLLPSKTMRGLLDKLRAPGAEREAAAPPRVPPA